MIDLRRNRAELLAEIEVTVPHGEALIELTDPRVATSDAHVRISGRKKNDLFSLLKLALAERFEAVPRPQLNRDLFIPLRNALGNAYRHGNAKNPARMISVEIVLGGNGAFVAVTDEGPGFDVAQAFRSFQQQEHPCTNRGAGFRNLHQAKSAVSYENGGRTLLLCFRPVVEGASGEDPQEPVPRDAGASPASAATQARRPRPYDPDWIQTSLSTEVPEFRDGPATIESCRVYAIRCPSDDDCGTRYLIRVASHPGQPAAPRILTGRLHATEVAAQADFEAAKSLHSAALASRLRIPRPVARFRAEPRLVVYEFDPWLNLREYLVHRCDLQTLGHAAERTGEALAALHRSPVALRDLHTGAKVSGCGSTLGAPDDLGAEHLRTRIARAESNLARLSCGSGLVHRLRVCAEPVQESDVSSRIRSRAPIHGALDWECIHFGADGHFYLFRFESCRWSDPGLDLGGFAADLLAFTLTNHSEAVYRSCLDTFLAKYNSQAIHPMRKEALRFYTALALVERLGRAEGRTKIVAERLLDALEAVSGQREQIGTREVPV